MTSFLRSRKWLSAGAVALLLTTSLAGQADARRGGSFGSRGSRTYSAPRSTYTAPRYTAPVQRSMTPNTGSYGRPGYGAARPGLGVPGGGGFAPARRSWVGPMLGGLAAGGLLGMMMGHGFGGGGFGGGGAGLFGGLIQLLIIGALIFFVLRLFRRRQPGVAPAGFGAPAGPDPYAGQSQYSAQGGGGFLGGAFGGQPGPDPASAPQADPNRPDEIGVGQGDFDAFERLLTEVQGAFGREDYAGLREHCTPEIVSYLSEELSQNAVAGKRNDVRDIKLLQGDLSEAWREGDQDYATVAMRYASIDVTRDRASGRVLEGDETRPTETTELWTFVRDRGGPWRLSAIQDSAGK